MNADQFHPRRALADLLTPADQAGASFPAALFIWLSPSFPVGAFAYSHGLERAVERGDVKDRPTLTDWIGDLVEFGSARNDLIVLAAAWRAGLTGDEARLTEIAELAVALQGSAERRLEAIAQGGAFVAAIRASWACAAVERLKECWPGEVAYPVAVGVAAAGHCIPLTSTLEAYALAFASNLVSAALRLSVIGQTDGQRALADLLPLVTGAARRAAEASLAELGSATFLSDLAAIQHETQKARLFRS
ncbi:MAG TPA: urease accessory protein UreF [Hyphomicrobiaceae bacterium]|nr:urease accessory protein UreF [Hyphomicrobiaceae bacterium]